MCTNLVSGREGDARLAGGGALRSREGTEGNENGLKRALRSRGGTEGNGGGGGGLEDEGHAPRSAEATEVQFHLTEILSDARFSERWQPKYGDKNQKSFSIMYLLKWKGCRVLVGYQRSKGEYVLYYISGGPKKAAR